MFNKRLIENSNEDDLDSEFSVQQHSVKRYLSFKFFHEILNSNFTVLLCLFFIAFASFKYAVTDFPRRDHNDYIQQIKSFTHPADAFRFSISYSRTRFLSIGDAYLFRPAHMMVLCMQEIFFDKYPDISGSLSIAFAVITAFVLFLISSLILKSRINGFVVSLLWLTFFPGADIVLWRHISPYLFSLSFGFYGIYYLTVKKTDDIVSHYMVSALMLLVAGLFHEAAVGALVLYLFLGVFFKAEEKENLSGDSDNHFVPKTSGVAFVVILIWLTLNLIDYYSIDNVLLFSKSDYKTDYTTFILQALHALFFLIWSTIYSLALPFGVSLSLVRDGHIIISFSEWHAMLIRIVCFLVGISIIIFAYYRYMSKKGTRLFPLFLYTLGFMISLMIALGLLRGGLRGVGYFHGSTYYLSIFHWLWLLLISFLLISFKENVSHWQGKKKKILQFSFIIIAFIIISVNICKLHNFTRQQYFPEAEVYWKNSQYGTFTSNAIVSGEEPEDRRFGPQNLFDGNMDSFYELSTPYPHRVVIQMQRRGKKRSFSSYSMHIGPHGLDAVSRQPSRWILECSEDYGASWLTLHKGHLPSTIHNKSDIEFQMNRPTNALLYRFTFLEGPAALMRLYEISFR